MSTSNIRLIISGFALLLFGIMLAIAKSSIYIIPGGLGLFLIIISCSVKDVKGEK